MYKAESLVSDQKVEALNWVKMLRRLLLIICNTCLDNFPQNRTSIRHMIKVYIDLYDNQLKF